MKTGRIGLTSKKTEGNSSMLTALCFAERELMSDKKLPYERRCHLVNDLESIYGALAELWSDEFEYLPTNLEGADRPKA